MRLDSVKFDMHTHGPWVFWKNLKNPLGKLIDTRIFPPKTIDTLLDIYLPKTTQGHIAVGICDYTNPRYQDLTSEVSESKNERKRLKSRFPIRDIDTISSKYFMGFKTSEGNQLYFVHGQEPHLPEGHLLLLPLAQRIETVKEEKVYKTPSEIAQDAKSNPYTLVFATHPGMRLSFAEKIALKIIREPSNETLGLTLEGLLELSKQGLLDGTEVYNSGAGKHNVQIQETTERLLKDYKLPTIACSDTMYPDNILTSYTVLSLDFSSPETLSNSLKQNLQSGNYSLYKGTLRASLLKQIKHFGVHLLTNIFIGKSHDYA